MIKLNWKGYSAHERMTAIEEIKRAVESSGGDIMDFHFFSDVSMSFQIEISSDRCMALKSGLSEIMQLDDGFEEPQNVTEVILLLNVSFSTGSGDLRQSVIDVPG